MISTAILLILSARSSDLSDLKSRADALGGRLDSFESKLLWASVFVGVGVLVECWPEAVEFWHEFRWPMAKFPRGKFWPLIGGVLVALGVIGEFWYTGKISTEETDLRDTTGRIEAMLNDEAQKANVRAGILERGAAQLTKDATDAKLETVRLEAQIQPRSYTPSEIAAIDRTCKLYSGPPVVMRSMAYDVEGGVFGTYLAQVLHGRGCGLNVNASGVGDNFMQNLPMFMDVHVTGPPDKQQFVKSLVEALNTPRVKAIAEPSPESTGRPVMIFIGAKRLSAPK